MLALLALPAALLATPVQGQASDFDHLAALVGHWRGSGDEGRVIDIRYRLISNGSALVEEWTSPRGNQTMTVYYRDNGAVLATHFCAQGNQPRLTMAPQTGGRMRFTFRDATNLKPGKSHLHDFWIEIDADETMRRSETYAADAKTETEVMVLRRVTPLP
jgi:hypothetical protein